MPALSATGKKQKILLTNELVLWGTMLLGAVAIVACQQPINCTPLMFRMMI